MIGKGNKERIVYLTDIALLYLKRYLEKRKDSSVALFAGKGTPRLTKGGIETLLKRIGNVAGVENVHPHRFRRTLATNLLDRGMSIQDVAVILGHADLKTTQIYWGMYSNVYNQLHSHTVLQQCCSMQSHRLQALNNHQSFQVHKIYLQHKNEQFFLNSCLVSFYQELHMLRIRAEP